MVSGGENCVPFDMWKATSFPTTETKFQVRHRMECGWVQAEGLYVIIIFKNIVENPLENL